jgi:alpha-L-rhamnosidase
LDYYLEQFSTSVERHGGHVHWAETGADACAIIVELAKRAGAREVVKGKSMVSEEIELNHALEAAGIRGVETDMGEFILQLAGERPAHIVAPAMHKTRADVADLFAARLDPERTEEPEQLTAIARRALRERFSKAGMGLSGANFAVADTGTIVLVENEGNIRFSATAPPVHVVLMGIEKIIPRLSDLAIFLRLLARSGTGQKLTTYTSLLTGPRSAGEDGPDEMHVILLDNGRIEALADAKMREALYCIRCGACLNACPVYRKIGGHAYGWVYSGPIGALVTPMLAGLARTRELPFASSLCGACREVCPVKINIPDLLLHLRGRAQVETRAPKPKGSPVSERTAMRAWAWAMKRPWAYSLGGRLARIAQRLVARRGWISSASVFPLSRWTEGRDFPALAPKPFRKRWKERYTMGLNKRLRRAAFMTILLHAGVVCVARLGYGQSGSARPVNLRCEYLSNPLGIDVRQPRFSWVLEPSGRGEAQTAYQVLVASRRQALDGDQGGEWDSGKVQSDDSTQVSYSGKPLESGRTYYWKVRTWDNHDQASVYSQVAEFEMGLLAREEWLGQWMGGAGQLRTEFKLAEDAARARAYVCGLGYYELRVNGRKIGTNVLDPAWTTYPKRVLYTTYDVTPYLKRGSNAIGVMLGNGWYKSKALLFQMNVELAGGKRVSLASGPSWKVDNGPITSDSVWDGEVYDARLETPSWDDPGFDDSAWKPAQQVKGPVGVLSAQMMPPIEVVDTMVPLGITNPKPGVYVYDMGQNISGWAELRSSGPRGSAVTLRFSELVYPDGTINRENIREAKSRDVYILKGGGTETYEPRFTYHGFRYVEVTGYPGAPSLDSLRGRVVHTAVATTGSFVASKQILNEIQKLIRWSQLTNLFSIPTDCDQRNERMGWMGDAQVTAEEATLNFDMAAFYTNFIRDIRDVQDPDGTITDTVPHGYGSRPADPAWGTAYPVLCWTMWQQYGDRRILEENYDGLKKYVEFLRSRAPGNVLGYSYYGDWVAIEHTPGALVSDAYYYDDVRILESIARILGKSADAEAYAQLAAEIEAAFNRKFLDTSTGNYANGTQTANAMALYLGLAPKDHRGAVAGNLTNDIVYGHDTHVTTGFIGVKFLMPALTEIGRSDLAYELATQTTYPSWGYMVKRGATTLWELWQQKTGPSMNSQDHAMFGSVGSWFYQALAGINVAGDGAADAGYRRIRIQPQIVEDLEGVSASVETVRGTVSSAWQHSPGTITLQVEIPAGSAAKVVVPKEVEMTDVTILEGTQVVWAAGRYVPGDPGVAGATRGDDGVVFDVGSGRYTFQLTGK